MNPKLYCVYKKQPTNENRENNNSIYKALLETHRTE
jgi:adenine specific DNA methylase Mod